MPSLEAGRLHVVAVVALLCAAAAPTASAQVLSQPPSVEFTTPNEGNVVRRVVNVTGEASDQGADGQVEEVQVRVDDGRWRDVNGTSEWTMTWDTTLWESGNHTLTARAEDDDEPGNPGETSTTTINVTVNQPPSIEIQRPWSNVTVAEEVTIQGTAEDPEGNVEEIEVRIDDGPWLSAAGTSEWSFDWNTSKVRDGDHTINARVHDGGDEPVARATVNVTVSNERENPPALDVRQPAPGASLEGTVEVAGIAQDPEGQLEHVEVRIGNGSWQPTQGTRDWSLSWDTTEAADGDHTIEIRASDPHGTTTQTRNVTVDNVDESAVEITGPPDGARVDGTVTVAGSAALEGGAVERVQVRIDDGPWRDANGTSDWTFAWNTTDVPDGSHRIEVRAQGEDASNGTATVDVRVTNHERLQATAAEEQQESQPPELSLEQGGQTEQVDEEGQVTFAGTVEDPDDESLTVEYRIDQGPWRSLEVSSGERFEEQIDVGDLEPGQHEVGVRATDGSEHSEIRTFRIEVEDSLLPVPGPGPLALVVATLAAARAAWRGQGG